MTRPLALTVTLPGALRRKLEAVVRTGYWGGNMRDAAAVMIMERLRELDGLDEPEQQIAGFGGELEPTLEGEDHD